MHGHHNSRSTQWSGGYLSVGLSVCHQKSLLVPCGLLSYRHLCFYLGSINFSLQWINRTIDSECPVAILSHHSSSRNRGTGRERHTLPTIEEEEEEEWRWSMRRGMREQERRTAIKPQKTLLIHWSPPSTGPSFIHPSIHLSHHLYRLLCSSVAVASDIVLINCGQRRDSFILFHRRLHCTEYYFHISSTVHYWSTTLDSTLP